MAGVSALPSVSAIIVDSENPPALAEFWGAVLGRDVIARTGPYVWLERRDGIIIGFQQVGQPKTGKNRLHLDLAASDPIAEADRIEALGGRHLPAFADGGFLVMADPEGNEFYVTPAAPFEVDDDGRTDYLAAER